MQQINAFRGKICSVYISSCVCDFFKELAKIDLTKCWNPLVYIENILTESKDQHWMSARAEDDGQVMVTERRRLRAIFLETLELNDFPLDVQVSHHHLSCRTLTLNPLDCYSSAIYLLIIDNLSHCRDLINSCKNMDFWSEPGFESVREK